MSAPLIWIALPLLVSGVLLLLNHRRSLTLWVATGLCVALAIAAGLLDIEIPNRVGPLTLEIQSSLNILGRSLVLDNADRGFLVLLYALGGVYFLGAGAARANRLFAPLGLAMLALLIAARSVQPFLYAALLVEMAVLISLPLMAPPGSGAGRGLMRYLIFQTLAMPFILLAGWVFNTIELNPANEALYTQAAVLLGLGFAIWLAVFPFYTWVPLLTEETSAYISGFVISVLTSVVLFYALEFLNGYAWLRTAPLLPAVLRIIGVVMVVTGGLWTAFQMNLERAFGYAFIMQTGYSLLAISLQSQAGLVIFAAGFFPRLLAQWLWAFALALLVQRGIQPGLVEVRGLFRRSPLLAVGLSAGWMSLAGLPLLAGFPIRQALLEGLAQQNTGTAFWALAGSMGLIFSGLRVIASMVEGEADTNRLALPWYAGLLLITALLLIFLIGIFPNAFLYQMASLVESFKNLP